MQQVCIGMCAELKDNLLKVEPTAVCMSYVTGTVRHNYICIDFKLLSLHLAFQGCFDMHVIAETKLSTNKTATQLVKLLCSRVHGQHHKVTHFHTNYLLHNTSYNVKVLLRAITMWNSIYLFCIWPSIQTASIRKPHSLYQHLSSIIRLILRF